MRFLAFHCNERDLDVAGIEPMRLPAMPNLWSMLNVAFFVESDAVAGQVRISGFCTTPPEGVG